MIKEDAGKRRPRQPFRRFLKNKQENEDDEKHIKND